MTYGGVIGIRLPARDLDALGAEAAARGMTKSDVARDVLARGLSSTVPVTVTATDLARRQIAAQASRTSAESLSRTLVALLTHLAVDDRRAVRVMAREAIAALDWHAFGDDDVQTYAQHPDTGEVMARLDHDRAVAHD